MRSQGPWEYIPDDGTGTLPAVLSPSVTEYGNFYVAQCNVADDAQFIVRACNNHDALLRIAQAYRNYLRTAAHTDGEVATFHHIQGVLAGICEAQP